MAEPKIISENDELNIDVKYERDVFIKRADLLNPDSNITSNNIETKTKKGSTTITTEFIESGNQYIEGLAIPLSTLQLNVLQKSASNTEVYISDPIQVEENGYWRLYIPATLRAGETYTVVVRVKDNSSNTAILIDSVAKNLQYIDGPNIFGTNDSLISVDSTILPFQNYDIAGSAPPGTNIYLTFGLQWNPNTQSFSEPETNLSNMLLRTVNILTSSSTTRNGVVQFIYKARALSTGRWTVDLSSVESLHILGEYDSLTDTYISVDVSLEDLEQISSDIKDFIDNNPNYYTTVNVQTVTPQRQLFNTSNENSEVVLLNTSIISLSLFNIDSFNNSTVFHGNSVPNTTIRLKTSNSPSAIWTTRSDDSGSWSIKISSTPSEGTKLTFVPGNKYVVYVDSPFTGQYVEKTLDFNSDITYPLLETKKIYKPNDLLEDISYNFRSSKRVLRGRADRADKHVYLGLYNQSILNRYHDPEILRNWSPTSKDVYIGSHANEFIDEENKYGSVTTPGLKASSQIDAETQGWRVAVSSDGSIFASSSKHFSKVRVYEKDRLDVWKQKGQGLDRVGIGWISNNFVHKDITETKRDAQKNNLAIQNDGINFANRQEIIQQKYPAGGIDLSNNGLVLAVGEPYYRQANSENYPMFGIVIVYRWNSDNNTWIAKGSSIKGPEPDQFFGRQLCLSGDGNTVAVRDHNNKVYVYKFQEHGSLWKQHGDPITLFEKPEGVYDYFTGQEGVVEQSTPYETATSDPRATQERTSISISNDGNILSVGYVSKHNQESFYSHHRISTSEFQHKNINNDPRNSDEHKLQPEQPFEHPFVPQQYSRKIDIFGHWNGDSQPPTHDYRMNQIQNNLKTHVKVFKYNSDTSSWNQLGRSFDSGSVEFNKSIVNRRTDSFPCRTDISGDGKTLVVYGPTADSFLKGESYNKSKLFSSASEFEYAKDDLARAYNLRYRSDFNRRLDREWADVQIYKWDENTENWIYDTRVDLGPVGSFNSNLKFNTTYFNDVTPDPTRSLQTANNYTLDQNFADLFKTFQVAGYDSLYTYDNLIPEDNTDNLMATTYSTAAIDYSPITHTVTLNTTIITPTAHNLKEGDEITIRYNTCEPSLSDTEWANYGDNAGRNRGQDYNEDNKLRFYDMMNEHSAVNLTWNFRENETQEDNTNIYTVKSVIDNTTFIISHEFKSPFEILDFKFAIQNDNLQEKYLTLSDLSYSGPSNATFKDIEIEQNKYLNPPDYNWRPEYIVMHMASKYIRSLGIGKIIEPAADSLFPNERSSISVYSRVKSDYTNPQLPFYTVEFSLSILGRQTTIVKFGFNWTNHSAYSKMSNIQIIRGGRFVDTEDLEIYFSVPDPAFGHLHGSRHGKIKYGSSGQLASNVLSEYWPGNALVTIPLLSTQLVPQLTRYTAGNQNSNILASVDRYKSEGTLNIVSVKKLREEAIEKINTLLKPLKDNASQSDLRYQGLTNNLFGPGIHGTISTIIPAPTVRGGRSFGQSRQEYIDNQKDIFAQCISKKGHYWNTTPRGLMPNVKLSNNGKYLVAGIQDVHMMSWSRNLVKVFEYSDSKNLDINNFTPAIDGADSYATYASTQNTTRSSPHFDVNDKIYNTYKNPPIITEPTTSKDTQNSNFFEYSDKSTFEPKGRYLQTFNLKDSDDNLRLSKLRNITRTTPNVNTQDWDRHEGLKQYTKFFNIFNHTIESPFPRTEAGLSSNVSPFSCQTVSFGSALAISDDGKTLVVGDYTSVATDLERARSDGPGTNFSKYEPNKYGRYAEVITGAYGLYYTPEFINGGITRFDAYFQPKDHLKNHKGIYPKLLETAADNPVAQYFFPYTSLDPILYNTYPVVTDLKNPNREVIDGFGARHIYGSQNLLPPGVADGDNNFYPGWRHYTAGRNIVYSYNGIPNNTAYMGVRSDQCLKFPNPQTHVDVPFVQMTSLNKYWNTQGETADEHIGRTFIAQNLVQGSVSRNLSEATFPGAMYKIPVDINGNWEVDLSDTSLQINNSTNTLPENSTSARSFELNPLHLILSSDKKSEDNKNIFYTLDTVYNDIPAKIFETMNIITTDVITHVNPIIKGIAGLTNDGDQYNRLSNNLIPHYITITGPESGNSDTYASHVYVLLDPSTQTWTADLSSFRTLTNPLMSSRQLTVTLSSYQADNVNEYVHHTKNVFFLQTTPRSATLDNEYLYNNLLLTGKAGPGYKVTLKTTSNTYETYADVDGTWEITLIPEYSTTTRQPIDFVHNKKYNITLQVSNENQTYQNSTHTVTYFDNTDVDFTVNEDVFYSLTPYFSGTGSVGDSISIRCLDSQSNRLYEILSIQPNYNGDWDVSMGDLNKAFLATDLVYNQYYVFDFLVNREIRFRRNIRFKGDLTLKTPNIITDNVDDHSLNVIEGTATPGSVVNITRYVDVDERAELEEQHTVEVTADTEGKWSVPFVDFFSAIDLNKYKAYIDDFIEFKAFSYFKGTPGNQSSAITKKIAYTNKAHMRLQLDFDQLAFIFLDKSLQSYIIRFQYTGKKCHTSLNGVRIEGKIYTTTTERIVDKNDSPVDKIFDDINLPKNTVFIDTCSLASAPPNSDPNTAKPLFDFTAINRTLGTGDTIGRAVTTPRSDTVNYTLEDLSIGDEYTVRFKFFNPYNAYLTAEKTEYTFLAMGDNGVPRAKTIHVNIKRDEIVNNFIVIAQVTNNKTNEVFEDTVVVQDSTYECDIIPLYENFIKAKLDIFNNPKDPSTTTVVTGDIKVNDTSTPSQLESPTTGTGSSPTTTQTPTATTAPTTTTPASTSTPATTPTPTQYSDGGGGGGSYGGY
tara:strand:- start:3704 stop:12076 length:8373 start_codon:yes stop_codon:yes gene_type:complete